MTVNNGLQLKIIYEDADLLELAIAVSNGEFAGSGDFYSGHELGWFATAIQGFPNSSTDTREITIGDLRPEYASGGVRLSFSCLGLSGRTYLTVEMVTRDQPKRWDPHVITDQRVVLWTAIEPASIDLFVAELEELSKHKRQTATLSFVTS